MHGANEIVSISRNFAIQSASDKQEPFVFWDENEVREVQEPLPLPFLGTRGAGGHWEVAEQFSCSKSLPELKTWIAGFEDRSDTYGFALTGKDDELSVTAFKKL